MAEPPAGRRFKVDLLALVRAIPTGRVATTDHLAARLGVLPMRVATLLAGLTDDERQATPWHRVVAKGGAIGRGPHRDAQFARLVREGVPLSPAGIVQDMARVAVTDFESVAKASATPDSAPATPIPPLHRSRGMKDRPG